MIHIHFRRTIDRLSSLADSFWNDDAGAVLSVEYVLLSGVLVTGVVPGLVAARNSINAAYANMGNSVLASIPTPSYSGYSIGGSNGNAIASIQGVSMMAPNQVSYLQASQVAPTAIPTP